LQLTTDLVLSDGFPAPKTKTSKILYYVKLGALTELAVNNGHADLSEFCTSLSLDYSLISKNARKRLLTIERLGNDG